MLQEGRALCRGWAVSTCLLRPWRRSSVSLEPTAASRRYPSEWHTGEEYSVPPSDPCLLQPCSSCHHPSLLSSWLLQWGKSPNPCSFQSFIAVLSFSHKSSFPLLPLPSLPPFSLLSSPPLLLSPLLLYSFELIRAGLPPLSDSLNSLQTNPVNAASSV